MLTCFSFGKKTAGDEVHATPCDVCGVVSLECYQNTYLPTYLPPYIQSNPIRYSEILRLWPYLFEGGDE